jgi:hypothetical protein
MYVINKVINNKIAQIIKVLRKNKLIECFDNVVANKVENIKESNILKSYKLFNKPHEVFKWGNQYYSKWVKSLTKEEFQIIQYYTGCSAGGTNTYLREKYKKQNDYYNDYIEDFVMKLNNALHRISVNENLITFRYMNYDNFCDYIAVNGYENKLIGSILKDNSFISTTLLYEKESAQREEDQTVLLMIKVPQGTKGTFIGNISNIKCEYELLICNEYFLMIDRVLYFQGCNIILLCNLIHDSEVLPSKDRKLFVTLSLCDIFFKVKILLKIIVTVLLLIILHYVFRFI